MRSGVEGPAVFLPPTAILKKANSAPFHRIQSCPHHMETPKRFLSAKPLILSAFVVLFSALAFAQRNDDISARARAIHDSAIVVDTHADTPQRFLDENFDIG